MALDNDHVKRMIRSWCVADGMTYDGLAEELGVPISTLKSWIYGQKRLSLDDAARICDVFNKPLDELVGRRDYAPGAVA